MTEVSHDPVAPSAGQRGFVDILRGERGGEGGSLARRATDRFKPDANPTTGIELRRKPKPAPLIYSRMIRPSATPAPRRCDVSGSASLYE